VDIATVIAPKGGQAAVLFPAATAGFIFEPEIGQVEWKFNEPKDAVC